MIDVFVIIQMLNMQQSSGELSVYSKNIRLSSNNGLLHAWKPYSYLEICLNFQKIQTNCSTMFHDMSPYMLDKNKEYIDEELSEMGTPDPVRTITGGFADQDVRLR